MTTAISADRSMAPGDLRALGAGDVVVLRQSARNRQDWMSILPALLIAIHRGASVIWKEG